MTDLSSATTAARQPLTNGVRLVNVSRRPPSRSQHKRLGSNGDLVDGRSELPTALHRKPAQGDLLQPLRPQRPNSPDLPSLDRCISVMFDTNEEDEQAEIMSEPDHDVSFSDRDKRASRASQLSTFSGRSLAGEKLYIGPWNLGKNLGSGSSARVRLCRHRISHELAAVKIVSKQASLLVQAGSMAALHSWDTNRPAPADGESRVPMTIEREVAMLQLIDHPNIIKLYDIWENRKEM